MTDAGLPREVEIAERCGRALDEGDRETARVHALEGIELARARGSAKWLKRFTDALERADGKVEHPVVVEIRMCTFCGNLINGQMDCVAGADVFICRGCVALCLSAHRAEAKAEHAQPVEKCSFCFRSREHCDALFQEGQASICTECVRACADILGVR